MKTHSPTLPRANFWAVLGAIAILWSCPDISKASEPAIPCSVVKLLVEPTSSLSANARVSEYSAKAGRAIESSAFGCSVASFENQEALRRRALKAVEAIASIDNPQWAFIASQSMAFLELAKHWEARNGEGEFVQNALLAATTSLERFEDRAISGGRKDDLSEAGAPLLFARMSFEHAPPAFPQWQRVISMSFGNPNAYADIESRLQKLLESPGLSCSYASTAQSYAHLLLARTAHFDLGEATGRPYYQLAKLHADQAERLNDTCPRDGASTPFHGTMTLRPAILP